MSFKPLTSKEFFDKFKVLLNLENTVWKYTSEAYSTKDNDVFIFEEEKSVDMYFQCPDFKTGLIPVKRNYIYKLPANSPNEVFYKTSKSKDGMMYKVKLDCLIKVINNPSLTTITESLKFEVIDGITSTKTVEEVLEKHGDIKFIEVGPEYLKTSDHTIHTFDGENIRTHKINTSILLEAESIVNGERNEQYNDPKESFKLYSEICNTAFGIEISPANIAKVMMAIKLGREKYKHKRDNLVDLTGYTEILNRLLDE